MALIAIAMDFPSGETSNPGSMTVEKRRLQPGVRSVSAPLSASTATSLSATPSASVRSQKRYWRSSVARPVMSESLRRFISLRIASRSLFSSLPESSGRTCVSTAMRPADSHFGARTP